MARRRQSPSRDRGCRIHVDRGGDLSRKPIPYGRQRVDPDDIAAVDEVLASERITQGPEIAAFEEELAEYCGASYAVAMSSGTAALTAACHALGIAPGTEGIVPALTFASTATCLLHNGARPVFADVNHRTGNLDATTLEAAITPESRVVLPVHYAGLPTEMEAIAEVARSHQLAIVEDATHALGARHRGTPVGACEFSDATVFSFHAVKSITTGEGGALLTNDQRIAEKARVWRHHGIQRYPGRAPWFYEVETLGWNARITDFQCALGRSQLKTLDTRISERNAIAEAYERMLAPLADSVVTPARAPSGSRHAYHLYPIRLVDPSLRRSVYDQLIAAGIGVQVHYVPAHWHAVFKPYGAPPRGQLLNTEAFYEAEISLPIYPGLTFDDQQRVVSALAAAIRTAGLPPQPPAAPPQPIAGG